MYNRCYFKLKDEPGEHEVFGISVEVYYSETIPMVTYSVNAMVYDRCVPIFIGCYKNVDDALKGAKRICERFPRNSSEYDDSNTYDDNNTIDIEDLIKFLEE